MVYSCEVHSSGIYCVSFVCEQVALVVALFRHGCWGVPFSWLVTS